MSHNTFGHLFRVTTFGESHGVALGCVVDGCPPGLALTEGDIQFELDRRRPGQSRFTTQRREPDQAVILSGVMPEGDGYLTTGTPITIKIDNTDQRSKDYGEIASRYRPGHADFTYDAKYGLRDYRGGGRSSARETASRVAAGAIARKVIPEVQIRAALVQIGPHAVDRARWDWDEVSRNDFFCPDPVMAQFYADYLDGIRKSGSSIGAVIEVVAEHVPAGWGAPVYGKLDADLAAGMMSINAVKGVEIGSGFKSIAQKGSEHGDELFTDGFSSNNAGGTLGGISTGQDLRVSIAIKPTSSIMSPKQSIDLQGKPITVQTKGRHDPCVGIRATPIAEAMLALVLMDHALRHRAQCGDVQVKAAPIPASRTKSKGD